MFDLPLHLCPLLETLHLATTLLKPANGLKHKFSEEIFDQCAATNTQHKCNRNTIQLTYKYTHAQMQMQVGNVV